jgi:hypothetical protein
LIIEMPCKKSVSIREARQLSWTGGNSGRMLFDDSNWNFDNVHHFITPNAEVNPNTTANEVDSDDESEKMSSVGSCYISSVESQCTNDETVSTGHVNTMVI